MKKLKQQFQYQIVDGAAEIWGKRKSGGMGMLGTCHPASIALLKKDWDQYCYLITVRTK